MIIIIDYGIGNLASIDNMFKKVGVAAKISCDQSLINKADKLVLPGVGAFDHGMDNLRNSGLIAILNEKVINQKVPILGICLGMQLMTLKSEEGVLPGLGWIDAETVRFKFDHHQSNLKIPHMGWNTLNIRKDTNLFNGIEQEPRFYFVHSYHVVCKDEVATLTKTKHGHEFVSSFTKNNMTGVQFHPEKSHKYGINFLRNWAFS